MDKQDFIDYYQLEDDTIILEDWDTFSKGIVGVSEDHCHIIYGYNKLVDALSESYKNENQTDEEDLITMAIEWIEYNTLRSIPYMDQGHCPIIMYELDEDV